MKEKLLKIIELQAQIIRIFRDHTADSIAAQNLSRDLIEEIEKLKKEIETD